MKSHRVSFDKAKEELIKNFKVVDNVISDKHAKSFIKFEYKPKKVQFQLININLYDLENLTLIGLSFRLLVYIG